MSTPTHPTCWIIAGPNGAGKTTFALQYLPEIANYQKFVNADLIAAGLSPLSPETASIPASKLFLKEIENCIAARKNFAFETTLSGRSYLKLIKQLRSEGWRTELLYLALPSIEMSKLRVAERVIHGGHNIPLTDIQRRFPRSLRNLLSEFSAAVDFTQCFMNDGESPQLIFVQQRENREIFNHQLFDRLLQEAAK